MRFHTRFFFGFLLVVFFCVDLPAQKKDRVEASQKFLTETISQECKDFKTARIISFPTPNFSPEAKLARAGGTVRVTVKIDERGKVSEVEQTEGLTILQKSATEAAQKAKFTAAVCDDKPTDIRAVFTYDFIPFVPTNSYFTPAKVDEFLDVKPDSPFYETVNDLTTNYRLAFGYADKKFYADAPLTRADFAHFLRLTLDLLTERAVAAKKQPHEINLFTSKNPQKILTAANIKDIRRNQPFYNSVETLLLKYDIALTNDRNEFQGNLHLTNNEIIDWWSAIFGEDSIPINFTRTADNRIVSRGEFALFLEESLEVLTYKVLP